MSANSDSHSEIESSDQEETEYQGTAKVVVDLHSDRTRGIVPITGVAEQNSGAFRMLAGPAPVCRALVVCVPVVQPTVPRSRHSLVVRGWDEGAVSGAHTARQRLCIRIPDLIRHGVGQPDREGFVHAAAGERCEGKRNAFVICLAGLVGERKAVRMASSTQLHLLRGVQAFVALDRWVADAVAGRHSETLGSRRESHGVWALNVGLGWPCRAAAARGGAAVAAQDLQIYPAVYSLLSACRSQACERPQAVYTDIVPDSQSTENILIFHAYAR